MAEGGGLDRSKGQVKVVGLSAIEEHEVSR